MALNITPNSTDTLANSQAPIKNNFATINDTFKIDHIEYATANGGMHNQIQFPAHINAIPSVAGNITLFNQTLAPTSIPDIWLKRGTAAEFPMTGFSTSNGGVQGWTYLPSGVLYAWGFATIVANGYVTITYISADGAGSNFPGFSVMATPLPVRYKGSGGNPDNFVYLADYNNLDFTVYSDGLQNNVDFAWHAIGI